MRHLQNYFSKPTINDLQRIIQRNLLIIWFCTEFCKRLVYQELGLITMWNNLVKSSGR